MPIVVEVKSPAEFEEWLRAKKAEAKVAGHSPTAPVQSATVAVAPTTTVQQ
jgi:hypothetical protein